MLEFNILIIISPHSSAFECAEPTPSFKQQALPQENNKLVETPFHKVSGN